MNIYDTDVGVAVRLSFTFSRPPEDFFKRDSVVLERTYGCSETIKGGGVGRGGILTRYWGLNGGGVE